MGRDGETDGGNRFTEEELGATWRDYVDQKQLAGILPTQIAVVVQEDEASVRKQLGRGEWKFGVGLLAIAFGVPLYAGNGSLASQGSRECSR